MKFKNPMLVVKNLEQSRTFYQEVLGLRVTADFGANITLTGGVSLQTQASWMEFLGLPEGDIAYEGRNMELYFEEDAFDTFLQKLDKMDSIRYVSRPFECPWGQKCVRFLDPDGHIIEVGEPMKQVCLRFLQSGMTVDETARRMDVPPAFVKRYGK